MQVRSLSRAPISLLDGFFRRFRGTGDGHRPPLLQTFALRVDEQGLLGDRFQIGPALRVGHELRTPLAGVRAISELLLDEEVADGAQVHRFLTSLNDEVIRMSDTINNLLEAARLSSGVAQWKWSRFSLRQVCEEAL